MYVCRHVFMLACIVVHIFNVYVYMYVIYNIRIKCKVGAQVALQVAVDPFFRATKCFNYTLVYLLGVEKLE